MQHTNTVRPRPSRALPVRNLPISYAFYTDLLGFGTTATALPDHLAEVTDFDDDPLLLIGPQASDVTTQITHMLIGLLYIHSFITSLQPLFIYADSANPSLIPKAL